MDILFILLILTTFPLTDARETLETFDFFGNGLKDDGSLDYAQLQDDPTGNLPEEFTICSSIYMKSFIMEQSLVQLLTADGEPWFSLYFLHLNETTMTHPYCIGVNGIYIHFNKIMANPLQWNHACIGINTVTGDLATSINNEIVHDGVMDHFVASNNVAPTNLTSTLILGKWYFQGKWLQSLGISSNVNVFGRKLSNIEMLLITNGTNCGLEGDYLSWNKMQWEQFNSNIVKYQVPKTEICSQERLHKFSLPDNINWYECRRTCKKFQNSHMPSLQNNERSVSVANWFMDRMFTKGPNDELRPFPSGCLRFWLPITDEVEDGVWVDYNSGKEVDFFEWKKGEPNGKESQNCGNLVPPSGWTDRPCDVGKCCICENEKQPILKLRGLCRNSKIDNIYILENPKHSGKLTYTGIYGTKIVYNNDDLTWEATIYRDQQVITKAITSAPKQSLLLGTYDWKIYNDSRECTIEESYTARLTMSGCNEDQFTCSDGNCIKMENRCDGKVDCQDTSDEINCNVLNIKGSYNKDISPPTLSNEGLVNIDVSIVMDTILKIDEIDEVFYLSFILVTQWFDSRLIYNNLKRKIDLNVLTPSQQVSIWSPQMIFDNTKTKKKSTLKDATVRILPNKNFTYEKADIASTNNVYLFNGIENKIEISQVYDIDFICKYNMLLYPFDTQYCNMDFVLTAVLDNFCQLNVANFSYTGPEDLRQYFIRNKTMYITDIGGQRGVRVNIILGRRLLSVLLTVFLPTILLNIMGHSSVYFQRFFFEAIITVNLTVMLVLTTMYVGVSNALPKTAYIKMIDVWFIFCMCIPFSEVLLQTYIEHLRAKAVETVTINHHGRTRNINMNNSNGIKKDKENEDKKEGLKSNLLKIFVHPFPSVGPTVSPVREAFGLDGVEENDFEQDNKEIQDSMSEHNVQTPKINMAIFVTQYTIPAFTIGFAGIYFLVGTYFVYLDPNRNSGL